MTKTTNSHCIGSTKTDLIRPRFTAFFVALPLLSTLAVGCVDTTDPAPAEVRTATGDDVAVYGVLKEIMLKADYASKVQLADVAVADAGFGVGAIEGLRGEITIAQDRAWLSYPEGDDAVRSVKLETNEEQAALLVFTRVTSWLDTELTNDVDFDTLDASLVQAMADLELDPEIARPFTIEGKVARIDWHVIDGSQLPDGMATHADHQNASVKGTLKNADVQLVGFRSTQHQGVFTHSGQTLHIHVIHPESGLSAHVDSLEIETGTVLRLANEFGTQ